MHFGPVDSFVRALYTFQSGRSDDTVDNSVFDTSSYGVFNIFLGVRDTQNAWEVTAWAKNLFDHQQLVRIGAEIQQVGILSGYQGVQVIPERQIGITGKYNFSF
jgi:iron complex outermembrane receptor protein